MELTQMYTPLTQEENDFIEMWKIEHLPESLRYGFFFWQYKITESQYVRIKEGLISLHFEDKNTKFIRRYAFHISLFLAEWFKREYDGYQNERGLSIIGVSSNQSKNIWEASGIPESYLVNSGVNEWLFSIYVLGGFPINYIRRVTRFDSLFTSIFSLKQGEDIDEDILDDLSDSFDSNNTVYQESMRKGGSLYAYIEDLLDDDIPLHPEEMKIEPYRRFCEMLSKGKRACYDSYLSCTWNLYTDEVSEGVEAFANVEIGAKNNRCYIPYDCVRMWQLNSVPNEFVIGLETGSGKKSDNTIRFSRAGKNFVGWGNTTIISMMFDVQDDQIIKAMLYSISDIERNEGKMIQRAFEFPNSCQFYQTKIPYKWSTHKDTKARSAVFFNSHKYQITEGKDNAKYLLPASNEKPAWIWSRIYDLVTLVDVESSEETNFNSKQGEMNVFFAKQKGVRYNHDDEVFHMYKMEDDTLKVESVPLILDITGIKSVKLYPSETNTPPERITDYKVYYKQEGWKYLPFDEKSCPKCGMLQLKIVYKDYKPIVKKCFFIPQVDFVKRKIDAKKIQFSNVGFQLWEPTNEEDYNLMPINGIFNQNTYSGTDDVVSFHIGREDDYIILDVYRADNCREIYFDNRCLSRKADKIIDIPLILRHKFSIRTIDGNGVKRTVPGRNVMLDFYDKIDKGVRQSISMTDKNDGICYYLYADKHDSSNGRNALKISPKQKDNYQFYYWSVNAGDEPIKLNTAFNEEIKCLIVPLDKFVSDTWDGIIFQSLKDATPPNYVFPYYNGNINWQVLIDREYKDEIIFKSFKIASEHKVYFSQFYPLHKLFESYDRGKSLIQIVVKYLRVHNKRQDFLSMHRFANEFHFEWFLLPCDFWKKECKDESDKELAEKLFRSNPYINSPVEKTNLDLILEKYWNLPKSMNWKFQRKKKIESIALQSMRGADKDFTFFTQRSKTGILTYPTENIKVLTEIYEDDGFYKKLQKEIFEKIINNK